MTINATRSANLSRRILSALAERHVRTPAKTESEPAYTRSVLAPIVRDELERIAKLPLQFRGDGGDSSSFPATALSIPFFPDLAVSAGAQHLWAAEVKILRASGRQNAIATALGQATLYRSRYEHVAVVLIDTAPTDRDSQVELGRDIANLGLSLILRPKLGRRLLQQEDRITVELT